MIKFRSKLLLVIISLIILVIIILGAFIMQLFEDHNYMNFEKSMTEQLENVTTYIEENGGFETLQNNKEALESFQLVDAVTLVTKDQEVIYTASIPAYFSYEQHITNVYNFLNQSERGYDELTNYKGTYYFWAPVIDKAGSLEGSVVIVGYLQDVIHWNDSAWYVLLAILIVSLLLISYLAGKMATKYMKPIEAATNTAIELAKGNYRARAYEDPTDEIMPLSTSINILARNLQEMENSREMQQDRLSTLIENIGSGVLLIDSKGYITLMNKAYKHLFNVSSSNYLYRLYYEVIPFKEVIGIIEDIFVTEKSIKQHMVLSLQIERKDFDVYGAPIIGNHDEWKGIVLVFHDITELKNLEKMRQDFVANVSHELRTPITSIKGFSETLLDGNLKDEKIIRDFLTIILNESDRLQALIQELLELSKIEKQEFSLSLTQLDLNVLLAETVPMFEKKAGKKGVLLHLELTPEPIIIAGDVHRLKQVFINLISNAVNYTPTSGSVTVAIKEDRKYAYVEVKDTGIGIETEEIPRIFERFYRVDRARSRNSGGTGLGLAIVKHLVEAHKGCIRVNSQVGKGTSFIVQLRKDLSDEKKYS